VREAGGTQASGRSAAAQYFDFNVRHFHEKLVADHEIKLSYSGLERHAKKQPDFSTVPQPLLLNI
jgi:hypothetical protein